MSKKVAIILEDLRNVNSLDSCFRVKQLKNTTEFSVGDYLSLSVVSGLCKGRLIDVQIVERKR